ncbi:Sec1-like protein [Aureobasidium sp. EXF-10727]|nr:Sec1-like protein [Aureobasidium sp. EXF-10727]
MGVSIIDAQRDIILGVIRSTTQGQWKVLVLDDASKKLLDNVLHPDDILNESITNIEKIEDRRPKNPDVDAIYLITPQTHIVDCVMADLDRRRYRKTNLIWTSLLPPHMKERLDKSSVAREQITIFRVLNIDFFPRESHLVTFRDPWSFPILFHPACNNLIRQHMEDLAQKIVGVCVALGEFPDIRYYRPRSPTHEASVLCSHLARFVQEELNLYANFHKDFPPPSNRPRATLYITDRSMDVFAPLLHEFTYQAMAHDLLPIREGDKITYKTVVNQGTPKQEEKDYEISEKDRIWVENRHLHMKDTIEKLMGDFQKFIDENPHFTKESDPSGMNGLNTIKDMLAGLPQFEEMKGAYSLHLGMAQECMDLFQRHKLPDMASVEQILATGLDEDYKKPKHVTDQVVRTLDDDAIVLPDRLRLIALYLIYKDGLLPADLVKLLLHAQLPPQHAEMLHNLSLLGIRTSRNLKDSRPPPIPLFPQKPPPTLVQEEYALSRFETSLQRLLDNHTTNTVDAAVFPYIKPPIDLGDNDMGPAPTSLRSAKPTWAKAKSSTTEPRQRVIVFMAGGATYSESRVCYDMTRQSNKEVFLLTSHMLTPAFFIRQVGDLSTDKRKLGIPAEQPPKQAPAHLFERDEPPPAPRPVQAPLKPVAPVQPPTQAMGNMNLGSSQANGSGSATSGQNTSKLQKDPEKKKRHFFSSKRG